MSPLLENLRRRLILICYAFGILFDALICDHTRYVFGEFDGTPRFRRIGRRWHPAWWIGWFRCHVLRDPTGAEVYGAARNRPLRPSGPLSLFLLLCLTACAAPRPAAELPPLPPRLTWGGATGQFYHVERADFAQPDRYHRVASWLQPDQTTNMQWRTAEPGLYRISTELAPPSDSSDSSVVSK